MAVASCRAAGASWAGDGSAWPGFHACARPRAGELIELARYTLTSGERVLFGQPIEALLRVTDRAADGDGPSYVVESALKRDALAALSALIADYLHQARQRDEIPMLAHIEPRITEVELLRYTVTRGERVLFGQRIDGLIRVTDRPASESGRSYLVECDLESDNYAALEALLADYLRQAVQLDEVPMAASVVYRSIVVAAARDCSTAPTQPRLAQRVTRRFTTNGPIRPISRPLARHIGAT